MATEMRNLKIDKVDLVDKGAQGDFVEVRLYKRDGSAQDDNHKSRTLRAQRSEGETMTTRLSDAQKADLPPKVVKAFEALEDELSKAKGEEETPLSKRDDLPSDVRKALEEQEARLAKAEAAAATERETRLRKEWSERVESLTNLPAMEIAKSEDGEQSLADRLYDISESDPDLAKSIHKMLATLDKQIGTSDLFAEIGKRGGDGENSAEGRMEKIVKGYVAEQGLSEPEAWAKALTEHSDVYSEYLAEKES